VSNICRLFTAGLMKLAENVVEMYREVLQVKVKVSQSKP